MSVCTPAPLAQYVSVHTRPLAVCQCARCAHSHAHPPLLFRLCVHTPQSSYTSSTMHCDYSLTCTATHPGTILLCTRSVCGYAHAGCTPEVLKGADCRSRVPRACCPGT
eukprot:1282361-Rhodomonas_salina.1